jgi:hypothetical protein
LITLVATTVKGKVYIIKVQKSKGKVFIIKVQKSDVVKVVSVQQLSLPVDSYNWLTHLFKQFIMIRAGDYKLKVVDVTTSEILLTFKHSKRIHYPLILKTSDPMTVVAVFKDY